MRLRLRVSLRDIFGRTVRSRPWRANSIIACIDTSHSFIYVPVLFQPGIEGRIAIVTDVGWNVVDAKGPQDEAAIRADGEVVWSWRPKALASSWR